jgi:transposase
MNTDWLLDARKIPDDVMRYFRMKAVYAVRVLGLSPEVVANVYNVTHACIYRWLNQYDQGGYEALESKMPPGAAPLITSEMDKWLKLIVLNNIPVDFGYDVNLWTCSIIAELLKREFGVTVSDSTVRLHLIQLKLSWQIPEYRDKDMDPQEIDYFLNNKFPRIQRLANKIGAEIGYEDESGVGVRTHGGRTWGLRGRTPVVDVSMDRGGYNMLSVVTPQGKMRFSVKEGNINGERYIEFLKRLIRNRDRSLILLVDHATFHKSKTVRDFVRAHRNKLRIFFLPKRAPKMNPDEQVWNEIKTNRIGKQPVKNKKDLKRRLYSALSSLQKNTKKILSFFSLPDTKYASENVS